MTLTPETLPFYHRVLKQPVPSLRIAGASILKTLVGKGLKDQSERLQVLKILDVVNILDPLEASTRDIKDDDDNIAFRASLGGILQVYGSDLIAFIEEVNSWSLHCVFRSQKTDNPENLRNDAERMMNDALPLLLRFLSDRQTDVPLSVNQFVSDLLKMVRDASFA